MRAPGGPLAATPVGGASYGLEGKTCPWEIRYLPHQAPMAHLFDPSDIAGPAIGVAAAVLLGGLGAACRRADEAAGTLMLVGLSAWICFLLPVGIGVSISGLHGFRYGYMPSAIFFALSAGALGLCLDHSQRAATALLLLWCVAGAFRVLDRAGAYKNDGTLFAAELAAEPDNPYAAGRLARHWIQNGKPAEGLELWLGAIDSMPVGRQLLDRPRERYELSQAAFITGRWGVALQQIEHAVAEWSAAGREPPRNAWCLLADSLDRNGRSDEAAAVEGRCLDAP